MRKKIYVAGKLNDDAVGYIRNFHRMIKTARELRQSGYAVYVPANDFLEGLVDGNFTYNDFFDNSQPWLLSADAIFLVPGWETSSGTKKEMVLAWKHNIPVFDDLDQMNDYFINGNSSGRIIAFEAEPSCDAYGEHLILNQSGI